MLKLVEYNTKGVVPKNEMDIEVEISVRKIIDDVRQFGDEAVLSYAKKFDGFNSKTIRVTNEEIENALKIINKNAMRILKKAKSQIECFHKRQVQKGYSIYKKNGVIMGQVIRPLERVAIYVPGGTAAYPSTVLMNAVPAKLAGVKDIVMFTPAKSDGKIKDFILAAAAICGITEIYKVGGVQSVAVAAYGTNNITKVDKIVGPGNAYVASAKKLLFGVVDIDMIAGPSEILIIADSNAKPAYIAADLLSQAEHDEMSESILITTDLDLYKEVEKELKLQLPKLKRKEIAKNALEKNGMCIIAKSIDEAFEISNNIAPEHLEIMTQNPLEMLAKVKNAGAVFLGENSPEVLGDYMSGTNHVLPTSGTAKFASPLGVYDFVKRTSYSYYPKNVLSEFRDDISSFALLEGLDAHANAANIRFVKEVL
ncbi:MAG: histidinol dehydrogenase [Endomicrobium sp.]|jgi:histidinol dehydrogenase|nr:histidinol dehydrogenase [Endomicrobium sp.]